MSKRCLTAIQADLEAFVGGSGAFACAIASHERESPPLATSPNLPKKDGNSVVNTKLNAWISITLMGNSWTHFFGELR